MYLVKFYRTFLGGGKWGWSFWKEVGNKKVTGRSLLCMQCGFETKDDAKQNWKEFAEGAAMARRLVSDKEPSSIGKVSELVSKTTADKPDKPAAGFWREK